MSTAATPSITGHSRPETVDDLPLWQREGHLIASVTNNLLTKFPEVGGHLLAAFAAAERDARLTVTDGAIRAPKTDDELAAALASAQRSWDITRDRYIDALTDPARIETWFRSSINNWAKAEGVREIEWPS